MNSWFIAATRIHSAFGGIEVVKIRLKKFGTKKRPFYRIVVQDSRKPRDGATLEEIGIYHPIEVEDKQIAFNEERARYWISVGAQTTDTVRSIFNKKNFTL
jgi:small subunit ribosomal protein S16